MSPRRETRPPRKAATPAKAKVAPRLVVSSSDARHELFAQEYLRDLNATGAYRRVYPDAEATTAAVSAYHLLRNPKIADRIRTLKAERVERLHLELDRPIRALHAIIEADVRQLYRADGRMWPINELPDDVAAAIIGVKIKRYPGSDRVEEHEVLEFKFAEKNMAIRTYMQHTGQLTERHEVTGANGTPLFPASEEEKAAREKQLVLQALQRIASGEAA